MKKILGLSWCLLGLSMATIAQSPKQKWVDSVYQSLSERERIGQLFMVAAYSGGPKYNKGQIESLISSKSIGGMIFMQGTPEAQAALTNQYQSNANVPLMIGMDAEWGLGMRLTGVKDFPRQMMLGASQNTDLMEQVGMAIAYQCKRMGVHVNFAPDIDVNNNPNNPVINFRSFGEQKELVAKMGIAYTKGLQDNGIMASVKHFPGHGDVDVDSHYDLPVIKKSKAELKALELYPFQELFKYGAKSVMIAHLSIPSLESRKNVPSTLSKPIVTDLLQKEMGFSGLIFTDALNMQGVTKYFPEGDADLEAFMAGNDVLLFSQDVAKAIGKINDAIKAKKITQNRLALSVKKILGAKYDAGLNKPAIIKVENATADLNQYTAAIFQKVANESVTLVSDRNAILNNIKFGRNHNIGYISIGNKESADQYDFPSNLSAELPNLSVHYFGKAQASSKIEAVMQSVKKHDVVFVGLHDLSWYNKNNYGIDETQLALIKQLAAQKNVMFLNFGNAYIGKNYCSAGSVLVAYEENVSTYQAVQEVIMGRLIPKGKLPVTVCEDNSKGVTAAPVSQIKDGIVVTQSYRPIEREIVKVDETEFLERNDRPNNTIANTKDLVKQPQALISLDQFLNSSVSKGVFPGAQVLAMKDGQVIYNKSFGKLDYSVSGKLVNANTIYDVASVTKIAATTLAIMKLYETGKISLHGRLSEYLPRTLGTDKGNLRISDILLHQAGLKAWIPFYKATLDSVAQPKNDIYSPSKTNVYHVPVASDMFMNGTWKDTVWNTVLKSPLGSTKYVYSDLDFLLLQAVVESVTGRGLDNYLQLHFYGPMGLKNTMFNPWTKGLTLRCAPTEKDNYFRYQPIQGYVHDMGAAMLGGVAGHAGLFSTAEDLAVIMQMLLNEGTYRSRQYLKPETVKLFTGYMSGISRRGYGFDKPEKAKGDGGPCTDVAGKSTFGHQGFTGTCAWADPETGIVFVFLSNRTFPTADNGLINKLGTRIVAQHYIYKALGFTK